MIMKKKQMDDLHILMVQILEEKGVSLTGGQRITSKFNDYGNASKLIVTKEDSDGIKWSSLKKDEVLIHLDDKMISIYSSLEDKYDIHPIPGSSHTEWIEENRRVRETYQIKDGMMDYSKKTFESCSKNNSMGRFCPESCIDNEESKKYELPDGYKITDGISAFTKNAPSKVEKSKIRWI